MSYIINLFNRLLPFATPGTPLVQDLLHLGAICALLYFAPQIQDFIQQRQKAQAGHDDDDDNRHVPNVTGDDPDAEPIIPIQGPVQGEGRDLDGFAGFNEAGPDPGAVGDAPPEGGGGGGGGDAGPAAGGLEGASAGQRNVGAKKAKSLARRDQRRAYNEFLRTQGDAQRARDAAGASEREAAQATERERRRAAEEALEAKRAREREDRRERERRDREHEAARREQTVKMVKAGLEHRRMVNLVDVAARVGGDVDEIWVERLLGASGMLGRSADGAQITMVTSTGWVARVRQEDMEDVYRRAVEGGSADGQGKIGHDELGKILEEVLRERSASGG